MTKNPGNISCGPSGNKTSLSGARHTHNRWASRSLMSAVLLAAIVAVGCKDKPEVEVVPTVTVQVGAAERGTIQRKITADVVLFPLDQAAIVPKLSAPVRKFYVQRG